MGLRGRLHDGQAQPGAFFPGPAACVVEPSEATEGPFGIFGRDPWPVVGHGQHRPPAVRPHRRTHPAGRVPDRVVQQVHQQPGQRVGVARHHARPGRLGPHRDPGRGVARRDRFAQRGQVGGRAAQVLPVQPGQQQQVLGQPGQPQRVGVHVARGLRPVQPVRVVQGHLELGADAGDRAAQLVRRVRDQVPLPLLGLGEPGEHVVQRDGERPHFVPGGRYRQVTRHAGLRHLGGAPAQRGDRPQRVPGEQPGDQGQQGEQQRRPDGQDPGQRGQAVAGLGVGDRGDDDVMPGRADGHHPQHRRQAQRRACQRAGLAGPRGRPRLGRRQHRHQPVRARRDVGDPAGGVEHLDGERPRRDRHRAGQPVLVEERRHLDRALPGRHVQVADERRVQRADQEHRRQGQGQRQPGRGGQRQPRPQAPPPPPHDHRQPPSAASR